MRNVAQIFIVVLILLVIAALIAPAIIAVREAQARMTCSNNLRLIAVGAANYTDTYLGKLPPAGELDPRLPHPVEPPDKRLSWLVVVVPFIEAGPLYNKLAHDKTWDAEENRFAALTEIRIFQCPGYPERPPVSTLVPAHYLGITGIGADAIALPLEDPRAGILGYDRAVKLTDLKRGAGETVLAVETSQASGAWTAAGYPSARGLEPHGSAYLGRERQFGGNHRKGANIGFADGSVRFIEQSIDPHVWEAMATLSGKANQE